MFETSISGDMREMDREARWAEIGYMLDEDHSGKGITTKACERLIEYLFNTMGMDKVAICCDDRNVGSIGLAKKLNFTLEGNLRNHYVVNGKVRNMNCWGLLNSQFQRLQTGSHPPRSGRTYSERHPQN